MVSNYLVSLFLIEMIQHSSRTLRQAQCPFDRLSVRSMKDY